MGVFQPSFFVVMQPTLNYIVIFFHIPSSRPIRCPDIISWHGLWHFSIRASVFCSSFFLLRCGILPLPSFFHFIHHFLRRMELRSFILLVASGSSQLHKMNQSRCMANSSWWWAERLPETCRVVIPIKLEFSASVRFIHKVVVIFLSWTVLLTRYGNFDLC
jgi:hypothetical protein